MEDINLKSSFVFGTQYYRSPTPLREDWERDLRRIKECKLNTIKIWCIWGWMEPEPGKYRFDEIDRLFDLAEEIGLNIVPNTITEVQPFWMPRLFPDKNMVNHRGEKIISSLRDECFVGLTPGQCLDYDEVNDQAEKFLINLGARYKDRSNLLAWDAWNEIMWRSGAEGLVCYCLATIKKFRKWLKEKYENLDKFNKAWMRIYSDWEDIFPPKSPRTGYQDMLDWRRFIIYKVTKMAESRVNALRKADSNHPVVIHTGGSSIGYLGQIAINGLDDWKLAETADCYGTSYYPNLFMPEPSPAKSSLCLDVIRSASKNKQFWISELQGGPASNGFIKKDITPEEQRLHIFSALSKGAKGILFWQWRNERLGREAGGYGLTDSEGAFTKRTQMAKDISRILNKHASLFNNAKALSSEAAILFDPDLYILNWAAEGLIPGQGGWDNKLADLVDRSIQGYYKAFYDNNIQCDFIHVDDLAVVGDYKIFVLPFPIFLKEKTTLKIKEYVQNGGIVISDAFLGKFGENCLCSTVTPGNGLDEVFQAREADSQQAKGIKIDPIKNEGLFRGFKEKDILKGSLFKNSLNPFKGSKVIASFEDKNPAIVEGRYQKGKTFLSGSLLGAAYLQGLSPGFKKLIKTLCEEAKIFPLVEIEGRHFVETRILKGKDFYLIFCLNSGNSTDLTLKLYLPRKKYKIYELVTGSNVTYDVRKDYLLIKTKVAETGVKMFTISL